MTIEVMCFNNGNVAVFKDGMQVPEAQSPWLLEVAGNLNKAGIDPTSAKVTLPDGSKAEFFRTEHGLNWRISYD